MKRKGVLLFVLVAITVVSLLGYFKIREDAGITSSVNGNGDTIKLGLKQPNYTPVIDPGHGGVDGGAVSVTGIDESGINLDISLKMGAFMRFLGVAPVMTRETDVSIHDPSANSISKQKVSDLKNRTKIANGVRNAALVSIHQNEFSNRGVTGIEVLYNGHEKSKYFAESIHTALVSSLNPNNRRESKKIGVNYLLNNVGCPAILIECGFLSNPTEEAKLRSKSYQVKIAAIIAVTYLNWTETP